MARDLRSLVGAGSARELQEKLESWHQDYELNSSGENLSRCCELLELNTAIQKQLFSILNEASQEDECAGAVKSCLLPKICCSAPRCPSLSQDSAGGELQLRDLACKPKCRLRDLEEKLAETRVELSQMEQDLRTSRAHECKTMKKLKQLCDYEQQLQLLQDEISILDCQKSVLRSRLARSCSPPLCSKPCSPCSKPCSPCSKPCSPCSKPCGPCGPCIPCDPCDPCSPCGPCVPCDPCDPCSPCVPCKPCDPCDPCNPCNPCIPCKPCDPCNPCSPCKPCDPCNPCIPCNPCDPCSPCIPCKPCDPCNPCSPCKPCDPCNPCSPCKPCDPCNPCSPCKPCDPCNPCSPCKPCDPCNPCIPCKPCDPCSPCSPCKPYDPCDPCNPCNPCISVKICSPAQCRRVNASRRACLIARFNFIYAKDRLDAEIRLKKFICDIEMVQRIIYVAVLESFRAARKAFWKTKISVKQILAAGHCGGPAALEVAVMNYIACHKELFDVCCCVQEVVCCLNMSPKLLCPTDIDFNVINCFIRELCCLAFSMQTLIPPLDVSFGIDGELFNRNMYYRSCDSDFTAPFVAYHIWPALMENGAVIVKGEVVTRKMIQCYRRSKLRSRSCGCGRRLLPGQVTRSRSLSTVRFKTSRH